MLPVIAFFLGFAFGWLRATKRGGNRLDKLQYGAAHGIGFAIAGVALGILIARMGQV
ncbi:hypothetical protein HMH01_07415 [Halovulum dunhuangense]|uniref:Uncharacterized protein n=1 Tax=Halovulum dunhuangense TaxID=1505036 RepID=A0A849L1U4_9RHOB|nr:hypothetical protein [Halovulum dunhuangense]NNU80266.1 hypothetical protein [Halovulum dunhuangense]